jgi:hypothetical protein
VFSNPKEMPLGKKTIQKTPQKELASKKVRLRMEVSTAENLKSLW